MGYKFLAGKYQVSIISEIIDALIPSRDSRAKGSLTAYRSRRSRVPITVTMFQKQRYVNSKGETDFFQFLRLDTIWLNLYKLNFNFAIDRFRHILRWTNRNILQQPINDIFLLFFPIFFSSTGGFQTVRIIVAQRLPYVFIATRIVPIKIIPITLIGRFLRSGMRFANLRMANSHRYNRMSRLLDR